VTRCRRVVRTRFVDGLISLLKRRRHPKPFSCFVPVGLGVASVVVLVLAAVAAVKGQVLRFHATIHVTPWRPVVGRAKWKPGGRRSAVVVGECFEGRGEV